LDRVRISGSRPLRGEVSVPPDKSITHRAVILASLARGGSRIANPLRGEDCLRTLEAFRALGVGVREEGGDFLIDGKGLDGLREPEDVIDCGNSGTTARLLAGVLAGRPFFSVLTGDASLRRRPMDRVSAPLGEMGARFAGRGGGRLLPLAVMGTRLRPIRYRSPVASAQVKTAVLLAGLSAPGETVVEEPGPSRDHTERMLPAFGVRVRVEGNRVSVEGEAELRPSDLRVPADLSSAAFFIVAALVVDGSELTIRSVGVNPTRTGLLDILRDMGADLSVEPAGTVSGEPVAHLHVRASGLRGVEVGGDRVVRAIDEFPVLCVAAALAEGETRIRGAGELRVKESDRIAVMAEMLRRSGVEVEERSDGMDILGRGRLDAAVTESRGDHRIAMAMAVAALRADGVSEIRGAGCVATSFPGFFEILSRLGGRLER